MSRTPRPLTPQMKLFSWLSGFGLVFGLGLTVVLMRQAFSEEPGQPPQTKSGKEVPADIREEHVQLKKATIAGLDKLDKRGFTVMPEAKPGEWLFRFHEVPQPLENYRMQRPVRPSSDRKTIVLQPLGRMNDEQRKVLGVMKTYAEDFFQLPARIAKPLPLALNGDAKPLERLVPHGQRHGTYDRQYNASLILNKLLLKKLPDDAVTYLGVTMEDLYVDDLNYVFGLGSFKARVGVYSLCRYFPEFWGQRRKKGDYDKAVLRACKVLNHETGHMFGLSHCVFFRCSMNGSNSLSETDIAPVHFCPVCHQKLAWNLKFDALKRYRTLYDFYKEHRMQEEADWMTKRLEAWEKRVAADRARADTDDNEPGE